MSAFIAKLLLLFVFLSCVFEKGSSSSSSRGGGDERVLETFRWGVATAAYQVEGAVSEDGRGASIWDVFSKQKGKIANGDTGNVADDSYHRIKEDVALIKAMGLNSYRFSISWSRIMPSGTGAVNAQGVAHYNRLIDELVAQNIDPIVTLYHWDLPAGLENKYLGWLSPRIEKDFAAYADVCFEQFGNRVKKWITLNEPWTFCFMGYVVGAFAPGRCSDRSRCAEGNSSTEGYQAAHNALNAHAAAVALYRNKYQAAQKGVIGIVLNHDWGEPLTHSDEDVAAAERRNEFAMGWFGDPVTFGHYPHTMEQYVGQRLPVFTKAQSERLKGSYDFLGLNHYSSKYYSAQPLPTLLQQQQQQQQQQSSPSRTNVDDFASGDQRIDISDPDHQHATTTWGGWADDQKNFESKFNLNGELIGPQAASPWLNVVPWGMYNVLKWSSDRYTIGGVRPIIYVTENGCDVPDESTLPLAKALDDSFRINYYSQYLAAVERAVNDGVDVRGYYAWSLLDNFEWADGYAFRFGLHYVDYSTSQLKRYPKASAGWYADYAAKHANFGGNTLKNLPVWGPPTVVTQHKKSMQDFLENALLEAGGRISFDL